MGALRSIGIFAAFAGPSACFVGCLLTTSLDGVSDEPPDRDVPDGLILVLPDSGPVFPLDDGAVRCGKISGDPCCTGGLCATGLECKADECAPPVVEPCGDDGQKCCPPSNSCKAGFECPDGKTCTKSPDPPPPCGHTTEICCSAGPACTDGNTICDGAHCVGCGADTQPCCAGACVGGFICNGVSCIACGGGGQPCCPGGGCTSGTICGGGTCVGCGGSGQPCCGGGACGGGLVCNGGACVGCGGGLQPCCTGGSCSPGWSCIAGAACKECCAKCSNRTEYHQVAGASDCTANARDYCKAVASRGSFVDAKWDTCAP